MILFRFRSSAVQTIPVFLILGGGGGGREGGRERERRLGLRCVYTHS